MKAMVVRAVRALGTWPSAAGWRESLVISFAALLLLGLIAAAAGLLHYRPRFDPVQVTVFVIPAFNEELIFRGPLPGKDETSHPVAWLLGGVLVFVAWHIVEARTFLPGATLFFTPGFLLCAAVLGGACAVMRYRTGSLWPATALHGVVVLLWQALFGGPAAVDLI